MLTVLESQIKAQLTINEVPHKLTGNFETIGRHAMDIIIQENAITGQYKLEVLEPAELAALTDQDISTLKQQYKDQIPGAVFMAIELKLATYEQLGIKLMLKKKK